MVGGNQSLNQALIKAMRLHAIVFSWPGQIDNAFTIARQLRGSVERLTVIDASQGRVPDDLQAAGDIEWVAIDPSSYYGTKFDRALRLFDGDAMLQIQADARHDDWRTVVERCRGALEEQPDIGIWSPDVWFTLFPTDQVKLFRVGESNRYAVAQSDCIVWMLARPVVERLCELDYSRNNLGWGIDWAAISYCYANKLAVVRDKSCMIDHPRSRNYDTVAARQHMEPFLKQLSIPELTQYRLLEGFIANTNLGVKGQLEALAQAARRAVVLRRK